VWVDLASVQTGDPARDAETRSPEFFDVDRFPQAQFRTLQIRLPDRGNPIVSGRLGLHGVERDLDVEVVARSDRQDPDGAPRLLYQVRTTLDRRDFGLRWNRELDLRGLAIGTRIEIEAHVEAVPQPA
jgi:polyisoprenoid-binding protein YceI